MMDSERILSIKQTQEVLGGMSRAQLYRLRFDPNAGMPDPVEVSPGRVGFLFSELSEWMRSRPRRQETKAGQVRREQTRKAGRISAEARKARAGGNSDE